MIPFEILTKWYMNEEECDMLYNSQFEPMEFPWLSDVRKWVNETYNTRLLTIGITPKGKRFLFYFYDKNNNIPRIHLDDGGSYEDMRNINYRIAKVSGLKEKDFDSVISGDFVSHWKIYLTSGKVPQNLSDRINDLFKNVNVFERFYYKECIMKTKAEAKQFLLSEEYTAIKKRVYDLLKSHDKYDLLEEKDVCIFVDYKEHMEKISMYGRWVNDMSDKEKNEYENSIINS